MKIKQVMIIVIAIITSFMACQDEKEPVPMPVACFEYIPDLGLEAGTEITFTNCSENAISFIWDFGDGNTSTLENPRHIYNEGGSYTVTMHAKNETGSVTKTEMVPVHNKLVACFEYSPSVELEAGIEINFTSCSENATSFIWNFGDGHTSTEENPTHIYDKAGEYTVTITAESEINVFSKSEIVTIKDKSVPADFNLYVSPHDNNLETNNLVLQGEDPNGNIISCYGEFNAYNFPKKINNVAIQMANSDTILVYHINNNQIEYFYSTYQGIKDSTVFYLDYEKQDSVGLIAYKRDWESMVNVFQFSSYIPKGTNGIKRNSALKNFSSDCMGDIENDISNTMLNSGNDILELVSDIGSSVAIAGTIVAFTATATVGVSVGAVAAIGGVALYAIGKAIPSIKAWFADELKMKNSYENYSCNPNNYETSNPESSPCGIIMSCETETIKYYSVYIENTTTYSDNCSDEATSYYIDGSFVGSAGPGDIIRLRLSEGEHSWSTSNQNSGTLSVYGDGRIIYTYCPDSSSKKGSADCDIATDIKM